MNQQQSICSQAREKTRAKRAATQVFSFLTLRAAAFVNCAALVIACVFLFVNGIGALNIDFVLDSPREMMTSGGVFPCLVGTFLLAAGAIAIALPFGVACAVWLNEYGKQGPVVDIVRLSVANLAGVPSIVFGLFGLAFFVTALGFNVSLLSGILTLAVLTLPVIINTTEEALKQVPRSWRDASLALGATKSQTIGRIASGSARHSCRFHSGGGSCRGRNQCRDVHCCCFLHPEAARERLELCDGASLPHVRACNGRYRN